MRPARRAGAAWCALALAVLATQAAPPAVAGTAAAADDPVADLLARACPGPAPGAAAAPAVADERRALALAQALPALVCRSHAVRRGEGQQQQADAQWQEAIARRGPELSAVARLDRDTGTPDQATLGLQARWVLSDFGAGAALVRAGRQARDATAQERLAQVLQALADGAALYAQAVAALGRHEAAASSLRTASANERMASARQQAGASSMAESLQALRALGQARLDFTRSQAAREQALLALKSALGRPADQPLWLDADASLAEALAWSAPLTPDHLAEQLAARLAEHPLQRAARQRLDEAAQRRRATDAERWGSVQLDALAGRARAPALAEAGVAPQFGRQTVALAWSLPLWDGGAQRARAQAAQGRAGQQAQDLDEAGRQLALAAQQALAALDGERQALGSAEQLVAHADQALQAAVERYRRGVGAYQDVLAAQDAAAAARTQRAEARAGVLRTRWQLAATLGDLGPLAPPPAR